MSPRTDDRPRGPVLVVHPSSELYGADRMLLESVRQLVAAHGDVVVAVPGPGPLVPRLLATGARVEQVFSLVLEKRHLTPRHWPALARDTAAGLVAAFRALRRLRPEAVYVNTLTLPLWPLLARCSGARVVVHVHEGEQEMPRLVRTALALPVLPAHSVLVNSEFSRSVLVEALPGLARRSSVVANGVAGPGRTSRPAREHLDGRLRIVYVGRLSERKGVHLLVDTLRHLEERGVHAVLDVVGDVYAGSEWYGERLRQAAETAGTADRVRFHGFHPDVWPLLEAADVAVVPSVASEPFGNTAVEALIAARPVVVADHSGLREAVQGCRSAQRVDTRAPGAAARLADALAAVDRNWAGFRAAAAADAHLVRRRHDPEVYGGRVAAAVAPPAPSRFGATDDAAGLPGPGVLAEKERTA